MFLQTSVLVRLTLISNEAAMGTRVSRGPDLTCAHARAHEHTHVLVWECPQHTHIPGREGTCVDLQGRWLHCFPKRVFPWMLSQKRAAEPGGVGHPRHGDLPLRFTLRLDSDTK